MKKSLIALAALSAIAGSAVAQSSVTVYGVLDAGYSETSKTISGTKNSQDALSFNNFTSSRFGVKGTEDLGGGLKANFTIETGIGSNPMAGFSQTNASASTKVGTTIDATSIGNRELNANIQTASGTTVSVGFGGTAIRANVLTFDAAYGSNLVGNVLTNDATFSSNRRTAAGVSQKVGDFTVGAALTKNDDSTATTEVKTASGYVANLGYAKGPLAFGAAYQSDKTSTNTVAAATNFTISDAACASGTTSVGTVSLVGNTATDNLCQANSVAATNKKSDVTVIGASYNFGVAQAFAQYGKVKTNDDLVEHGVGDGDRSAYSVGVRVPMGKVTLFAQMSDGEKSEVITRGTAAIKRDWSGSSVGALYSLSKRTSAYAAIGKTKLDGTSGVTNEVKVEQFAVGMAHSF
jgi:predicted porin